MISEQFPNTPHQKCIVHLQRNLQAQVRGSDKSELAEDIKNVLLPDDENHTPQKAQKLFEEVAKKWESR